VTSTNNYAEHFGASIYCNNSFPLVVNSILYGNTGGEVHFASFDEPSAITISHSTIEGGLDGITTSDNGTVNWLANLDQPPRFYDEDADDYRLTLNSPCVDAGTALVILDADTLLALTPADYLGSAPDMGLYEFQPDTLNMFPLQHLRRWTYASDNDTMSISILDVDQINDHNYYEFDEWFSGEGFNLMRDSVNQVYVYYNDRDHLLYDFGAPLGSSWTFPDYPDGSSTMTLVSVGDTVSTPYDTFHDCYQMQRYFGTDFVYNEWFAPNYGLVQRDIITFAGLQRYVLIDFGLVVNVEEPNLPQPENPYLYQNYPNPFNPVTVIDYYLPESGSVELTIYDLNGRTLRQLVKASQPAGGYSVLWDGRNQSGRVLEAGIYFCQLKTSRTHQVRKLSIIK
jgi:hypothetical protein